MKSESHARPPARAQRVLALRAAVADGQFVLHYQPQLTYAGRLTGAEALLRWRHGGALALPDDFITLAEETGLIVELGAWVLAAACRQLSLWQRSARTRHLSMAVNVSARQLAEPDFVAGAMAMIAASGADPQLLKLELTESLHLGDIPGAAAKMQRLRALGVRFSLDDFGTGHASLRYLRELPLDQLKIDQSFVRDIATSGTDAAIVRSTVSLAHSLGLDVIAEGVETVLQRDWLARCGCYDYQGFLFDHALSATAFARYARGACLRGERMRPRIRPAGPARAAVRTRLGRAGTVAVRRAPALA